MAGGEARTGYVSADVVQTNVEAQAQEARTGYVSADVVQTNVEPSVPEGRVWWHADDVVAQNTTDGISPHEGRVWWEAVDVVARNAPVADSGVQEARVSYVAAEVVAENASEARLSYVSSEVVISTHPLTPLSITVTPANSTVGKYVNKPMTATLNYSGGFTENITNVATWSSSLANIATIGAANGVATGVAIGVTTISATYAGLTGSTPLTVIENTQVFIVENVKQGTFYADEWQLSSDNMQASVSARDGTRDSQDQSLDIGIFWRDYSAGQAVADLMRTANIGDFRINYNDTYTNTVLRNGPVQYMKMDVDTAPKISITDWWARYWFRGREHFTEMDTTLNPDFEENLSTLDYTNHYPTGSSDYYNARYETFVTFDYAETYTLEVLVDDGARVYVDGEKIIDAWRSGPEVTVTGNYVNPVAGNVVKVVVEFYQHTTINRLRLRWSSSSQAIQVIPSTKTNYYNSFDDIATGKTVRVHQAGTARSPALVTSDPTGSSLLFDGTNGFAFISTTGIEANTSKITVEFLASATNATADSRRFFDFRGTYGAYFDVSTVTGGSTIMEIFLSGSTGNNTYRYARPAAGIHHYVVQFDKSTNPDTIKLWIDGVLQTPTSTTTANNTDLITNNYLVLMDSNAFNAKVAGYMDEFAIYPYLLTPAQIVHDYKVSRASKIDKYPLLYGKDETVWDTALNIATADLGMFFLDEDDKFYYESANEFYSTAPNRHTSVQYELVDDEDIISGNQPVQLQANRVTVKVNPATVLDSATLSIIWSAADNESLAVSSLTSTMSSSTSVASIASTVSPLWTTSGYFKIDDEIMQYTGVNNNNQLTGVTRGLYGTKAVAHSSSALVREVRVYDIEYSDAPVSFVAASPLILAQIYDNKVDIDAFTHDAWQAHIIVSANENCIEGELVMLQGTHPITELIYTFELVGIPIKLDDGNQKVTSQVASNSDNIRKYRIKDLTIDNKFVQTKERATDIGAFILARYQDPVPLLEVECMAIPQLQLGDRVRIGNFDQFNIVDEEYWIIEIDQSYDGGVRMNLKLRAVS